MKKIILLTDMAAIRSFALFAQATHHHHHQMPTRVEPVLLAAEHPSAAALFK